MDLTIVITTRNRSEKLIRVIKNLEDSKFKGKLLIGDASDYKNSYSSKQYLKKTSLNYEYIFHEGFSVMDSHNILASKISTKYSLCIADGALVILDGIKKCLNHLENNSDLVAISGQVFNFEYKKKTNFKFSYYKMPNIKDQDVVKRFSNICRNYNVGLYCVMQSKVWIHIWKNLEKIDTHPLAAEIIPNIKLFIAGNVSNTNTPYLLREMHSKRVSKDPKPLTTYKHFLRDYKYSIDMICKEIKLFNLSISKEKIKNIFDSLIYKEDKKNYLTRKRNEIYSILSSFDLINNTINFLKVENFGRKFSWNNNDKYKLREAIQFIKSYKDSNSLKR